MYYILEFPPVRPGAQKDIAIVHQNWIQGETCYWPSFWKDSKKLTSALLKGDLPNKQLWASYKGWRIVGNKMFETYDLARKILPKAIDCSDLSSTEDSQSRLRNRRRRSEQQSEDGSSESSDHDHPVISTPPTGRLSLKSKRQKKTAEINLPLPPLPTMSPLTSIKSGPSLGSPMLVAVADGMSIPPSLEASAEGIPGTAPSFMERDIRYFSSSGFQIETTSEEASNRISDVERERDNITDASSPFGMFRQNISHLEMSTAENDKGKNKELLEAMKCIQTNQDIIIAKQDMTLEYLRALLQGRQTEKDLGVRESFALPLTEMDNFKSLESEVKTNSCKRKDLVIALSKKGGNSPNQVTYRIMSALMTDALMMEFSFAGHTGKMSFRTTAMLPAICDAVRLTEKGSVANDKEIEKAIEYWLKKASKRIKTREEKRRVQSSPGQ